jgi:hypothetical protein
MATDHEHVAEAPPAGEQIHMPEPSILPILNAAGLSVAIVGITISPVLIVGGLLLFLGTAIAWILAARREMEALPLEHGH